MQLVSLLMPPTKFTYRNFTRTEFACKCGQCESTGSEISGDLLDALQALRTMCDFPFIISSGYRCPSHPIEKKKVKAGTHALGLAVDISVSHGEAVLLLNLALASKLFTGIGVQQKGSGRFIHLDIADDYEVDSPRPTIWSY